MQCAKLSIACLVAASLLPGMVMAQTTPTVATVLTVEIRQEIEVLAEVLEGGLELDTGSGFLGINSGRVEGVYLQEQGVLLEIRTPLASQRNRVSLSALASSLRNLSAPANPFEQLAAAARRPVQPADQVLAETSVSTANISPRPENVLPITEFQALVDSALSRADRAARMLRNFGTMTPDDLIANEQELASLRQQFQENLAQLRLLESRADAGQAADQSTEAATQQPLQDLQSAFAELGNRATELADSFEAQYQQARDAYRERWLQDVEAFESRLFGLLCTYGATLESLPSDQFLSVVLTGLGGEVEQTRAGDRILVIRAADLVSCGEDLLDADTLQRRATGYDY